MTRIRISIVKPRGGVRSNRPFFYIVCQDCGHDDLLTKDSSGEQPLLLSDAYGRAERMYRDHLSGDGEGGRRCPVAALVSAGVWRDESDEVCDRCGGDHLGDLCPERPECAAARRAESVQERPVCKICGGLDCPKCEIDQRAKPRRAAKDVCTRMTSPLDVIGADCPRCRHTNLVHPGLHNLSLTQCAVCALEAS